MNLGFSMIMFIVLTVLALIINVVAVVLEKKVDKKKSNYINENKKEN